MTTVTVDTLSNLRNDRILKLTSGAVIIADYTSDVITDVFDGTGNLVPLPSGYVSCGLQDTSGIAFNRSLTADEVMSWQSPEVQRSDISSDKIQVQAKFQETNIPVVALNEGRTLAEVSAAYGTGSSNSMHLDKNPSGVQPLRRVLLIATDETRAVIVARSLPRSQVTALGGQAWQRATELQTDITFDCFPDQAYGTSYRYFLGGDGLSDLMSDAAVIAAWQATHVYATGDFATVTGGTLQATTGGTSGASEPVLPASVGGTVTDGSVTWTRTA